MNVRRMWILMGVGPLVFANGGMIGEARTGAVLCAGEVQPLNLRKKSGFVRVGDSVSFQTPPSSFPRQLKP